LVPRRSISEKEHHEHLAKYNINANRAMFTLLLSVLVDVFGYSMVLPLLPEIGKVFGASDFLIGILISSNAFTALIFGPILGKLSDKFGRKPILLISQIGTGVAFLLLALSNSIEMILFSRIFDGIFGGQIPVIRAYIADITTADTRSSKIGKIMVGNTLGMILGPSIGGLLGVLNWRFPGLFASGLSIVNIILTVKVLIESMPKERIADLKDQMTKFRESSNVGSSVWNKELVIRFSQLFFLSFTTIMLTSSLALVLDKRYGADPLGIGSVMSVAGIIGIFYGGFLLKFLIKKIGEKRIFLTGLVLLIVVFIFYPYLYEMWMVYAFIPLFMFSMAFLMPLIQSNITKAVDPDRQGQVSGWSTNVQSFAQTIAPLLSTWYLQLVSLTIGALSFNSYELIGFTAMLLAIILAIIGFIDVKTHKHLYDYYN
jgi:DHA1 family tetracycline resistance protein-like MFS transporter